MTVFAPSDVRSISIPTDRGGCGHSHDSGELAAGERFAVDCPMCEPHIIGARLGWAHTEHGVHLTPDEIGEVEAQEADAKRAQNRTWGDPSVLGKAFADALRGVSVATTIAPLAPTAESLRLHIEALPAEERALLAAMFDTSPDEGEDFDGDDGPDDPTSPPVLDLATGEPVKRGPGRPRKNPLPA